MKEVGRVVLSLALVTVGIGGFIWMGTPQVATRRPAQSEPPLVETVAAQEHRAGVTFEVDGVVVPFRQIEIASQVSGRIEYKSDQCRVGRAVKKGDLLIRIEKRDYKIEVRRLTEELKQSEAMIGELDAEIATTRNQIESARAQLKIEERQLRRNRELLGRRAASEAEVDTARRAELTTRNELQKLIDQETLLVRRRVRLDSAQALSQANLDKAELALSRTDIRSPLDGVIVSETVEQDSFVQVGTVLVGLQDTSQLDVQCKLHVRQMYWLWQGQSTTPLDSQLGDLSDAYDFPETPATIVFNLEGMTYHWDGVVNRYDGAGIDNQTRMVPCRVFVSDPLAVTAVDDREQERLGESLSGFSGNPPTLMTGMFVKVRVHANPTMAMIRLPQSAVQPGNKVWTVDEQGLLQRAQIAIASADDDYVIAYQQDGGLTAGADVVVSPIAGPMEGLQVRSAARTEQPTTVAAAPGRDGEPGNPQAKASAEDTP